MVGNGLIFSGDSSVFSLHLELRLWADIGVIKPSGQPNYRQWKILILLLYGGLRLRLGAFARKERRIAKNYKAKFLSTKYCWLKLVMNVKLVFFVSWVKLVFVEVRLG